MYNVFKHGNSMIVAIIKTGAGLMPVEEFRKADSEAQAVTDFCAENTPPLNEVDYIGKDGDGMDLQQNWGWDFSEPTPTLKAVVTVLNKVYLLSGRDIDPIMPELKKKSRHGYILFNEIIAKYFGLRSLNGELTEDNIDYCYGRLMPATNMLIRGHVKQAKKRLNKLFVAGVTQDDIDNGYTQDIHDAIVQDITNYLTP